MVGGRLMLFGRYWFTTPARSDTVGSLNEENEDARGHGFVGDPGLGSYFDSGSWYLPRENVGGDLMIEREEILELADRMENHVTDRGGPSKDIHGNPVLPNGAWSMMLEAAKVLRSVALPAPDVAGFEACREECKMIAARAGDRDAEYAEKYPD